MAKRISTTSSTTSVLVSLDMVTLLEPNPKRLGATITNDSGISLTLRYEDQSVTLSPMSTFELPAKYMGCIKGYWGSHGEAKVTEHTGESLPMDYGENQERAILLVRIFRAHSDQKSTVYVDMDGQEYTAAELADEIEIQSDVGNNILALSGFVMQATATSKFQNGQLMGQI